MTFKETVKLHRTLYKLGSQIIKHKRVVKNIPYDQVGKEFDRQENRIQKYMNLSNKLKRMEKNASNDINYYWTGY